MKRLIDEELSNWKSRKDRKVLLLRGARQVGKTFSIRKLGKTFKKFLEVNFEENPHLCSFFKESLNPFEINEKLALHFNKSIKPGETLLFFDEIQACPGALRSLRFYYEKMPGLHVAAAGSLLVNRGNLCELFVGLELIAGQPFRIRPELYYWHREARSSNAEVDYVISNQGCIIPVEVKAGTRGQMQSLHLFLAERMLDHGLRISGENFAIYDNIKTIPLYAVSRTRHLT
jgi:predicted AAA+ superfamily ATPase